MAHKKPFLDKATNVGIKIIKVVYVDTTKAGYRAGRGKK